MIMAITAAGIGILILLLSIWAKSRIYETGILLSVGKSKWEILAQRITEILLIMVLAFGMTCVCGDIAAKDVGYMLLSQANEQNTRVEELTVNISADIIVAAYVTELLAVLLSVCIASIPVMSIKPKTILTSYE